MVLDVNSVCNMIDSDLITFIHNVILVIKIAVPIFLIIYGMIDFIKGVMASKEDEMKKSVHVFIQRLIAGVIVFFMVSIAQFVTGIIDKEGNGEFWRCANAIMSGKISIFNEEKREYDVIDDYCCNQVGGSLNENNVCKYPSGRGIEYTECLKAKNAEKESQDKKHQ